MGVQKEKLQAKSAKSIASRTGKARHFFQNLKIIERRSDSSEFSKQQNYHRLLCLLVENFNLIQRRK
jgi:hypothetical protein